MAHLPSLSTELINSILLFLRHDDLLHLAQVSRRLHSIVLPLLEREKFENFQETESTSLWFWHNLSRDLLSSSSHCAKYVKNVSATRWDRSDMEQTIKSMRQQLCLTQSLMVAEQPVQSQWGASFQDAWNGDQDAWDAIESGTFNPPEVSWPTDDEENPEIESVRDEGLVLMVDEWDVDSSRKTKIPFDASMTISNGPPNFRISDATNLNALEATVDSLPWFTTEAERDLVRNELREPNLGVLTAILIPSLPGLRTLEIGYCPHHILRYLAAAARYVVARNDSTQSSNYLNSLESITIRFLEISTPNGLDESICDFTNLAPIMALPSLKKIVVSGAHGQNFVRPKAVPAPKATDIALTADCSGQELRSILEGAKGLQNLSLFLNRTRSVDISPLQDILRGSRDTLRHLLLEGRTSSSGISLRDFTSLESIRASVDMLRLESGDQIADILPASISELDLQQPNQRAPVLLPTLQSLLIDTNMRFPALKNINFSVAVGPEEDRERFFDELWEVGVDCMEHSTTDDTS